MLLFQVRSGLGYRNEETHRQMHKELLQEPATRLFKPDALRAFTCLHQKGGGKLNMQEGMMASSIREILSTLSDTILQRGEDYYASGCISSLNSDSEGVFTGKVSGSNGETYTVQVRKDASDDISDYSCTCPYDYSDVCKHIAAVLLAIEDGSFKKRKAAQRKPGTASPATADLAQLLGGLTAEKVRDIILAQAQADEKFRSDLILAMAPPDKKADMAMVREKILRSIRANTRKGFIDYAGCDAVCDELSDCLSLSQSRLDKGHMMSAFEITLFVLLTGADLASSADSSSGSLTYVIDDSFEKLEAVCTQIAGKADAAAGKHCYDTLCRQALNRVFIGWSSWSYDLLKIAAMFVSEKNKSKISDTLSALRNHQPEKCSSAYEKTEEDLVMLKMIRILQGEKAARAFIDSRLDIDRFRELALEDDLRNGDYMNAEKLCQERIKRLEERWQSRPSEWWYRLYEIHERSGDREKMAGTAKSLLLQGDLAYYKKLKAFLSENGIWEETYPLLRAELKVALPGSLYAQILELEDEHALLLEEVKRDSRYIFRYGKMLAEHYPKAVYELYHIEISKAARESTNRSQYSKLCGLLRELHQAGGKDEALALAEEFIRQYPRRPAMLEELANLKRRLNKPSKVSKD